MSRLIIKNLPKNITEDKLRTLFSQKGTITDIQLKYTKEGVFRQFAFIGYQTDDEAQNALKYFNNTCIQTSRIKVEMCAPLGAEEKPKSWSKYAKDSTTYKKEHGIFELEEKEREKQKEERKKNKKNPLNEILDEHKDDPDFAEFMKAHDKNRELWGNDASLIGDVENTITESSKSSKDSHQNKINTQKPLEKKIVSENDDDGSDKEEDELDEQSEETKTKLAEEDISDLQYMKQLKKGLDNKDNKEQATHKKTEASKTGVDLFTIKIHNIPYKTKRQEVIKFFKPIKPYSVRLPTKVHGFCYVGFKTERDFKKAMLKNKSFIKEKQVFFSDFTEKNKISKNKIEITETPSYNSSNKNSKWAKQAEALNNEEDISESGRIFFRNLAYTTTENDMQELFEKYGPIAEINLPIDPMTRQIKGFGTVTFVMPEHAVKAFSELDGSLVQGRLLHLIPGKSRDTGENEETEGLSFKAKKELKLKKSAGQSHNWNTLFLGANAVADILAKKFETSKENILDSNAGGSSAAVRLALGEVQIVMEMRKFLEENEVQLNVFDTESKKRSKTVILAKNLPAETTVAELQPLFSKYGLIGRIVLPPSGVTAIVEFLDPSEAKQAFKKLAYSKFKTLPLYLEWAPEETFKTKATEAIKYESNENTVVKDNVDSVKIESNSKISPVDENDDDNNLENNDDDDDEPPEPETTLFLRNLNFKTREDAVRNHFKHVGPIHIVQVATKKDPEDPANRISLGYGFIQFKKKKTAEKALKDMQFTQIEGNQVELKRSDRTLKNEVNTARKATKLSKQTGSKILVRNIPFQAKTNEVRDIFKAFGELRSVRLPKKMTPGEESHRGFGFVDFLTKGDAKKAFDTLSQSTHLYGRRLVLEWASVTEDDVDELRKRTVKNFSGPSNTAKRSRKAVFDTNQVTTFKNDEDMEE